MNTSTQLKNRLVMDLQWEAFDFNNIDLAFVRRQFAGTQGPRAIKIADSLRWWAAPIASNVTVDIAYSVTIGLAHCGPDSLNEAELFSITETNNGFIPQIDVSMRSSPNQQFIPSEIMAPAMVISLYDQALNSKRGVLSSSMLSAHAALRSRIADACAIATKCGVRANIVDAYFEENNRFYALTFSTRLLPWFADHLPAELNEVTA